MGEPLRLVQAAYPKLRPVEDASGPYCILDLPSAACHGATIAYFYFDQKHLLREIEVLATLGARPYGLTSTCVKQTQNLFSRTAYTRFEHFGLDSTDTFSHYRYRLSSVNR
ncbi:hypothetical protein GCM10023185_24370 [Hymenobacter saemangeumensis]|uniref:Uncharacterized protein n=1 Tax=Hymenobacter saemangeumensis TaxID=1084522 RepID=A0ABP8IHF5_9BACT